MERLKVTGPRNGELQFDQPETNEENDWIFRPKDKALFAARTKLTTAVSALCEATPDWEYREPDEVGSILADLRKAGAELVTALAGDQPREKLIEILLGTDHLLCSMDLHLPWEFLYLGSVQGPVLIGDFFGARAVVGRPFSRRAASRALPDALAEDGGPLTRWPRGLPWKFGYAEDSRLQSAKSGAERAVFSGLGIELEMLPPLLASNAASRTKLFEFIAGSELATHFNCHADAEVPGTTEGAIYVSEKFKIEKGDIGELEVRSGSIVVLNCCSGHTMRHDVEETVADKFVNKRVQAVVATTEKIADVYATRWARNFYKRLGEGQRVPQAILETRKQMLSEENPNPSALFYAYLGKPGAELRRVLGA